jgi:hypothetical protein
MMLIENAELSLRAADHLSERQFSNVEQGLEPRHGLSDPARARNPRKPIYEVPPANPATYAYEDKLKKLRKLFYVDLPEQTGDTPPTLGAMARRDGPRAAPHRHARAAVLARGPGADFLRFKYLLEKSGAITAGQVDGRTVATLPRNPAQAAAEQQELGERAHRADARRMFPEEFKMNVDGRGTMDAVAREDAGDAAEDARQGEVAEAAVDQMAKLVRAAMHRRARSTDGTRMT